MSASPPRPPAALRRLLVWTSRRLGIPELAEDAEELFAERAAVHGERRARRWYRRQTSSALGRLILGGGRPLPSHGASMSRHESRRIRFRIPGASLLDVRLAARMLARQPALTLVAIFALAIGIPVGLLPLHILSSLGRPLPVEDGERIVMLRNYDRLESRAVERPLHDFMQWRDELRSFEQIAMWRSELLNVVAEDGHAAPAQGAEVSASFFPLHRVQPAMGRPLTAADEIAGAPHVAVIGHEFWQSRLGGGDILGSTIRIGGVPHTVVGVMPEGFRFPYRDDLWMPLRYDPLAYARGSGPSGVVMARLADGASIEQARAEFELLGQRMAAAYPETHEHLRPQVLDYTRALTGVDGPEVSAGIVLTQILAFFLLVLACGNVGILVLARVATRTTEIAVRTALGASRGRILGQLFVESLLLAALGAAAGLVLLQVVATGPDYLVAGLPFWVDFEVSLRTAGLAMTLAILSAAIAGVVPALKATSRNVRASIQRASATGSGIRFGGGYSTLIIGEVAVAVVFLAFGWSILPTATAEPAHIGIRTDHYLHASVHIPRMDESSGEQQGSDSVLATRVATVHRELARRLAAEPGIGPVAIASTLPGTSHATRYVEVEGLPRPAGAPAPAWLVTVARVDVGFFDALEQPILSGRNFNAADLGERRSAVIVNTSFVERVLGGRNPIGLRIRQWLPDREPGPWTHEIVGVVGRLGTNSLHPDADAGVYQAAAPGELHPVTFAVRVGESPERFTPRLRSIVAGIDAGALIRDPVALSDVPDPNRRVVMLGTWLVVLLAGIAMVLAAACLYALMSFTVAERRRESAIRAALGAQRGAIVAMIARRAFLQLIAGVAIGAALSAGLMAVVGMLDGGVFRTSNQVLGVGLIAALMVAVGMLACVKPMLRAIRIQPAEALKA